MTNTMLLTEHQAAEFLILRVKTLQAWRVRGGGPKFLKLGRCVRYSLASLEEFLAECTMTHTPPKEWRPAIER